MKLWHAIGLVIGVLLLIGGSLALILQDNPRYAPGEATAMVERVYRWRSNSADRYSDLYEEYLGQGVWEVKSSSTYNGEQAVFRVYETTDTVAIYNATAQAILNRREQLDTREKESPSGGAIAIPVTPTRTPSTSGGEFNYNDFLKSRGR